MSRGPGAAQVRVLEALAIYDSLGKSLQWRWNAGGSFYRKHLTDAENIEAYEAGLRVEVWMLRRDTGLPAPEVSRALRSLDRRGFVILYDMTADVACDNLTCGTSTKFVRITNDGKAWEEEEA